MPLLLTDRAVTSSPLRLVTASEARMLRLDTSSPRWRRIRRGIHVDRTAYDALKPWQKYAVRVHAFAQAHPHAALCLESAAVVHGLPLFGETRDIHVFDAERTASRRFGDVSVHTSADERVAECIDGILVISVLDTAIDLARVLPPAQALALVDAVLSRAQGGSLSLQQLHDGAASQQSTRGTVQLRWLWNNADPLAESPGESVSRAVIAWSGFPAPTTQRSLRYEGRNDRVDFYFEGTRTVGESDGWGKYQLETDPTVAARLLSEEKRREDRLRRHGHPFARWDLRDAFRVTPLQDALRAASVPLVRRPDAAMLATHRRRPREAGVRQAREKPS